eukprot:TRINITY_DN43717_c0_g1_i1.p2 TRINITY_DN43717_c0_g1~~TRINITY_DN43717_c0_g1_i1.p2  ORF type:complete len:121 (-),score=30.55 TRINITY_DN43717_c0_g1_i1:50-412(-)
MSFLSSMFQTQPPKTQMQLRDEHYVNEMLSLSKVLDEWKMGRSQKGEALLNADSIMSNIMATGTVNGDNCKEMLEEKGLDDDRRVQLQRTYQELKAACGQKVPTYGAEGAGKRKEQFGCC